MAEDIPFNRKLDLAPGQVEEVAPCVRRILVDHARRKKALKREGAALRIRSWKPRRRTGGPSCSLWTVR